MIDPIYLILLLIGGTFLVIVAVGVFMYFMFRELRGIRKYTKGARDELRTQNTAGKLPAIIPVTDPALTAYFKDSFGTGDLLQVTGTVNRPDRTGTIHSVETTSSVS